MGDQRATPPVTQGGPAAPHIRPLRAGGRATAPASPSRAVLPGDAGDRLQNTEEQRVFLIEQISTNPIPVIGMRHRVHLVLSVKGGKGRNVNIKQVF